MLLCNQPDLDLVVLLADNIRHGNGNSGGYWVGGSVWMPVMECIGHVTVVAITGTSVPVAFL